MAGGHGAQEHVHDQNHITRLWVGGGGDGADGGTLFGATSLALGLQRSQIGASGYGSGVPRNPPAGGEYSIQLGRSGDNVGVDQAALYQATNQHREDCFSAGSTLSKFRTRDLPGPWEQGLSDSVGRPISNEETIHSQPSFLPPARVRYGDGEHNSDRDDALMDRSGIAGALFHRSPLNSANVPAYNTNSSRGGFLIGSANQCIPPADSDVPSTVDGSSTGKHSDVGSSTTASGSSSTGSRRQQHQQQQPGAVITALLHSSSGESESDSTTGSSTGSDDGASFSRKKRLTTSLRRRGLDFPSCYFRDTIIPLGMRTGRRLSRSSDILSRRQDTTQQLSIRRRESDEADYFDANEGIPSSAGGGGEGQVSHDDTVVGFWDKDKGYVSRKRSLSADSENGSSVRRSRGVGRPSCYFRSLVQPAILVDPVGDGNTQGAGASAITQQERVAVPGGLSIKRRRQSRDDSNALLKSVLDPDYFTREAILSQQEHINVSRGRTRGLSPGSGASSASSNGGRIDLLSVVAHGHSRNASPASTADLSDDRESFTEEAISRCFLDPSMPGAAAKKRARIPSSSSGTDESSFHTGDHRSVSRESSGAFEECGPSGMMIREKTSSSASMSTPASSLDQFGTPSEGFRRRGSSADYLDAVTVVEPSLLEHTSFPVISSAIRDGWRQIPAGAGAKGSADPEEADLEDVLVDRTYDIKRGIDNPSCYFHDIVPVLATESIHSISVTPYGTESSDATADSDTDGWATARSCLSTVIIDAEDISSLTSRLVRRSSLETDLSSSSGPDSDRASMKPRGQSLSRSASSLHELSDDSGESFSEDARQRCYVDEGGRASRVALKSLPTGEETNISDDLVPFSHPQIYRPFVPSDLLEHSVGSLVAAEKLEESLSNLSDITTSATLRQSRKSSDGDSSGAEFSDSRSSLLSEGPMAQSNGGHIASSSTEVSAYASSISSSMVTGDDGSSSHMGISSSADESVASEGEDYEQMMDGRRLRRPSDISIGYGSIDSRTAPSGKLCQSDGDKEPCLHDHLFSAGGSGNAGFFEPTDGGADSTMPTPTQDAMDFAISIRTASDKTNVLALESDLEPDNFDVIVDNNDDGVQIGQDVVTASLEAESEPDRSEAFAAVSPESGFDEPKNFTEQPEGTPSPSSGLKTAAMVIGAVPGSIGYGIFKGVQAVYNAATADREPIAGDEQSTGDLGLHERDTSAEGLADARATYDSLRGAMEPELCLTYRTDEIDSQRSKPDAPETPPQEIDPTIVHLKAWHDAGVGSPRESLTNLNIPRPIDYNVDMVSPPREAFVAPTDFPAVPEGSSAFVLDDNQRDLSARSYEDAVASLEESLKQIPQFTAGDDCELIKEATKKSDVDLSESFSDGIPSDGDKEKDGTEDTEQDVDLSGSAVISDSQPAEPLFDSNTRLLPTDHAAVSDEFWKDDRLSLSLEEMPDLAISTTMERDDDYKDSESYSLDDTDSPVHKERNESETSEEVPDAASYVERITRRRSSDVDDSFLSGPQNTKEIEGFDMVESEIELLAEKESTFEEDIGGEGGKPSLDFDNASFDVTYPGLSVDIQEETQVTTVDEEAPQNEVPSDAREEEFGNQSSANYAEIELSGGENTDGDSADKLSGLKTAAMVVGFVPGVIGYGIVKGVQAAYNAAKGDSQSSSLSPQAEQAHVSEDEVKRSEETDTLPAPYDSQYEETSNTKDSDAESYSNIDEDGSVQRLLDLADVEDEHVEDSGTLAVPSDDISIHNTSALEINVYGRIDEAETSDFLGIKDWVHESVIAVHKTSAITPEPIMDEGIESGTESSVSSVLTVREVTSLEEELAAGHIPSDGRVDQELAEFGTTDRQDLWDTTGYGGDVNYKNVDVTERNTASIERNDDAEAEQEHDLEMTTSQASSDHMQDSLKNVEASVDTATPYQKPHRSRDEREGAYHELSLDYRDDAELLTGEVLADKDASPESGDPNDDEKLSGLKKAAMVVGFVPGVIGYGIVKGVQAAYSAAIAREKQEPTVTFPADSDDETTNDGLQSAELEHFNEAQALDRPLDALAKSDMGTNERDGADIHKADLIHPPSDQPEISVSQGRTTDHLEANELGQTGTDSYAQDVSDRWNDVSKHIVSEQSPLDYEDNEGMRITGGPDTPAEYVTEGDFVLSSEDCKVIDKEAEDDTRSALHGFHEASDEIDALTSFQPQSGPGVDSFSEEPWREDHKNEDEGMGSPEVYKHLEIRLDDSCSLEEDAFSDAAAHIGTKSPHDSWTEDVSSGVATKELSRLEMDTSAKDVEDVAVISPMEHDYGDQLDHLAELHAMEDELYHGGNETTVEVSDDANESDITKSPEVGNGTHSALLHIFEEQSGEMGDLPNFGSEYKSEVHSNVEEPGGSVYKDGIREAAGTEIDDDVEIGLEDTFSHLQEDAFSDAAADIGTKALEDSWTEEISNSEATKDVLSVVLPEVLEDTVVDEIDDVAVAPDTPQSSILDTNNQMSHWAVPPSDDVSEIKMPEDLVDEYFEESYGEDKKPSDDKLSGLKKAAMVVGFVPGAIGYGIFKGVQAVYNAATADDEPIDTSLANEEESGRMIAEEELNDHSASTPIMTPEGVENVCLSSEETEAGDVAGDQQEATDISNLSLQDLTDRLMNVKEHSNDGNTKMTTSGSDDTAVTEPPLVTMDKLDGLDGIGHTVALLEYDSLVTNASTLKSAALHVTELAIPVSDNVIHSGHIAEYSTDDLSSDMTVYDSSTGSDVDLTAGNVVGEQGLTVSGTDDGALAADSRLSKHSDSSENEVKPEEEGGVHKISVSSRDLGVTDYEARDEGQPEIHTLVHGELTQGQQMIADWKASYSQHSEPSGDLEASETSSESQDDYRPRYTSESSDSSFESVKEIALLDESKLDPEDVTAEISSNQETSGSEFGDDDAGSDFVFQRAAGTFDDPMLQQHHIDPVPAPLENIAEEPDDSQMVEHGAVVDIDDNDTRLLAIQDGRHEMTHLDDSVAYGLTDNRQTPSGPVLDCVAVTDADVPVNDMFSTVPIDVSPNIDSLDFSPFQDSDRAFGSDISKRLDVPYDAYGEQVAVTTEPVLETPVSYNQEEEEKDSDEETASRADKMSGLKKAAMVVGFVPGVIGYGIAKGVQAAYSAATSSSKQPYVTLPSDSGDDETTTCLEAEDPPADQVVYDHRLSDSFAIDNIGNEDFGAADGSAKRGVPEIVELATPRTPIDLNSNQSFHEDYISNAASDESGERFKASQAQRMDTSSEIPMDDNVELQKDQTVDVRGGTADVAEIAITDEDNSSFEQTLPRDISGVSEYPYNTDIVSTGYDGIVITDDEMSSVSLQLEDSSATTGFGVLDNAHAGSISASNESIVEQTTDPQTNIAYASNDVETTAESLLGMQDQGSVEDGCLASRNDAAMLPDQTIVPSPEDGDSSVTTIDFISMDAITLNYVDPTMPSVNIDDETKDTQLFDHEGVLESSISSSVDSQVRALDDGDSSEGDTRLELDHNQDTQAQDGSEDSGFSLEALPGVDEEVEIRSPRLYGDLVHWDDRIVLGTDASLAFVEPQMANDESSEQVTAALEGQDSIPLSLDGEYGTSLRETADGEMSDSVLVAINDTGVDMDVNASLVLPEDDLAAKSQTQEDVQLVEHEEQYTEEVVHKGAQEDTDYYMAEQSISILSLEHRDDTAANVFIPAAEVFSSVSGDLQAVATATARVSDATEVTQLESLVEDNATRNELLERRLSDLGPDSEDTASLLECPGEVDPSNGTVEPYDQLSAQPIEMHEEAEKAEGATSDKMDALKKAAMVVGFVPGVVGYGIFKGAQAVYKAATSDGGAHVTLPPDIDGENESVVVEDTAKGQIFDEHIAGHFDTAVEIDSDLAYQNNGFAAHTEAVVQLKEETSKEAILEDYKAISDGSHGAQDLDESNGREVSDAWQTADEMTSNYDTDADERHDDVISRQLYEYDSDVVALPCEHSSEVGDEATLRGEFGVTPVDLDIDTFIQQSSTEIEQISGEQSVILPDAIQDMPPAPIGHTVSTVGTLSPTHEFETGDFNETGDDDYLASEELDHPLPAVDENGDPISGHVPPSKIDALGENSISIGIVCAELQHFDDIAAAVSGQQPIGGADLHRFDAQTGSESLVPSQLSDDEQDVPHDVTETGPAGQEPYDNVAQAKSEGADKDTGWHSEQEICSPADVYDQDIDVEMTDEQNRLEIDDLQNCPSDVYTMGEGAFGSEGILRVSDDMAHLDVTTGHEMVESGIGDSTPVMEPPVADRIEDERSSLIEHQVGADQLGDGEILVSPTTVSDTSKEAQPVAQDMAHVDGTTRYGIALPEFNIMPQSDLYAVGGQSSTVIQDGIGTDELDGSKTSAVLDSQCADYSIADEVQGIALSMAHVDATTGYEIIGSGVGDSTRYMKLPADDTIGDENSTVIQHEVEVDELEGSETSAILDSRLADYSVTEKVHSVGLDMAHVDLTSVYEIACAKVDDGTPDMDLSTVYRMGDEGLVPIEHLVETDDLTGGEISTILDSSTADDSAAAQGPFSATSLAFEEVKDDDKTAMSTTCDDSFVPVSPFDDGIQSEEADTAKELSGLKKVAMAVGFVPGVIGYGIAKGVEAAYNAATSERPGSRASIDTADNLSDDMALETVPRDKDVQIVDEQEVDERQVLTQGSEDDGGMPYVEPRLEQNVALISEQIQENRSASLHVDERADVAAESNGGGIVEIDGIPDSVSNDDGAWKEVITQQPSEDIVPVPSPGDYQQQEIDISTRFEFAEDELKLPPSTNDPINAESARSIDDLQGVAEAGHSFEASVSLEAASDTRVSTVELLTREEDNDDVGELGEKIDSLAVRERISGVKNVLIDAKEAKELSEDDVLGKMNSLAGSRADGVDSEDQEERRALRSSDDTLGAKSDAVIDDSENVPVRRESLREIELSKLHCLEDTYEIQDAAKNDHLMEPAKADGKQVLAHETFDHQLPTSEDEKECVTSGELCHFDPTLLTGANVHQGVDLAKKPVQFIEDLEERALHGEDSLKMVQFDRDDISEEMDLLQPLDVLSLVNTGDADIADGKVPGTDEQVLLATNGSVLEHKTGDFVSTDVVIEDNSNIAQSEDAATDGEGAVLPNVVAFIEPENVKTDGGRHDSPTPLEPDTATEIGSSVTKNVEVTGTVTEEVGVIDPVTCDAESESDTMSGMKKVAMVAGFIPGAIGYGIVKGIEAVFDKPTSKTDDSVEISCKDIQSQDQQTLQELVDVDKIVVSDYGYEGSGCGTGPDVSTVSESIIANSEQPTEGFSDPSPQADVLCAAQLSHDAEDNKELKPSATPVANVLPEEPIPEEPVVAGSDSSSDNSAAIAAHLPPRSSVSSGSPAGSAQELHDPPDDPAPSSSAQSSSSLSSSPSGKVWSPESARVSAFCGPNRSILKISQSSSIESANDASGSSHGKELEDGDKTLLKVIVSQDSKLFDGTGSKAVGTYDEAANTVAHFTDDILPRAEEFATTIDKPLLFSLETDSTKAAHVEQESYISVEPSISLHDDGVADAKLARSNRLSHYPIRENQELHFPARRGSKIRIPEGLQRSSTDSAIVTRPRSWSNERGRGKSPSTRTPSRPPTGRGRARTRRPPCLPGHGLSGAGTLSSRSERAAGALTLSPTTSLESLPGLDSEPTTSFQRSSSGYYSRHPLPHGATSRSECGSPTPAVSIPTSTSLLDTPHGGSFSRWAGERGASPLPYLTPDNHPGFIRRQRGGSLGALRPGREEHDGMCCPALHGRYGRGSRSYSRGGTGPTRYCYCHGSQADHEAANRLQRGGSLRSSAPASIIQRHRDRNSTSQITFR